MKSNRNESECINVSCLDISLFVHNTDISRKEMGHKAYMSGVLIWHYLLKQICKKSILISAYSFSAKETKNEGCKKKTNYLLIIIYVLH